MSTPIRNPKIRAELSIIRNKNGGMLEPEMVVAAAKSPKSRLHPYFEWEDTEAAYQWRLHQARNLIRVVVRDFDDGKGGVVEGPEYQSIVVDRVAGDGYRAVVDILTDEHLRKQMLRQALSELEAFQRRYSKLKELASIFESIENVNHKLKIEMLDLVASGERNKKDRSSLEL